jgi:hypothetical protein
MKYSVGKLVLKLHAYLSMFDPCFIRGFPLLFHVPPSFIHQWLARQSRR